MTLAIVIRAAGAGSLGWSTLVTDVTWLLVWVALPAAVGIAVRTRREATARVQEEQARRAVSEERLRMAQEVHDVVGHGLAVIAMQASAGLHVLDRHPEKVRQVLEAIQATSRESLEGLRAELATLRGQSGENSSRRPHAGLRDIPLLVERVRAGGLDVRLELEPLKSPPPQAVDVAAYRIVQEAVTNVLRHAGPSATARVRVREVRGQLLIEVSDTGEGLPMDAVLDGSGVAGMRDRAHRVGGSVDVVRRPSGGVRVTALLPLTTESVIGSATGSLPDSATDLATGSPEVQP
jgi:signal transduction histidine kinase